MIDKNTGTDPEDDRLHRKPDQEEMDYGDDTPIAQGDSSITDVPQDISPGDEIVMIDERTGEIIDLSDVEEMEAFASIADTGGLLVDSDVEEHAPNSTRLDDDVLADFNDRMQIVGGSERIIEDLAENNGLSPEISGNDIDAAWQYADQSGEEAVGGSVPTPDQDVVEELGQALGIEYNDFEPLNTEEKLASRDENRWELDADARDEYQRMDSGDEDNENIADDDSSEEGGFGSGMENIEL